MNEQSPSRFRLTSGGNSGLPVSLEEPYRVIQTEESARAETPQYGRRMLRFLSQRLAFLSAAALLLGGLFGLALVWTLWFWIH